MSQIYSSTSSTPAVATTYVTDVNSPAVPAANILNVVGGFVSDDVVNGIQTDGSSGSNTLTVELTNRIQGTGQTVGAVTDDLVTFSAGATPGVFTFEVQVVGFESTTPAGAGFSVFGTVRTTGAAATVVGTPDVISNNDAALSVSNADIVVSGNNIIVQVTGVAALTIDWETVGTYTFIG